MAHPLRNMIGLSRGAGHSQVGPTREQRDRADLLPLEFREELLEGWRAPAHWSTKVLLRYFNESTGVEFFITGWDGQHTVSAYSPTTGVRNVGLHEVTRDNAARRDESWNSQTLFGDLRKAVPQRPSGKGHGGFKTSNTLLDEGTNKVTSLLGDLKPGDLMRLKSKPSELPSSFLLQEAKAPETTKFIVACGGAGWDAYTKHSEIPPGMSAVRIVHAANAEEAIQEAQRQLQEREEAPAANLSRKYGLNKRTAGLDQFFENLSR